MDSLAPPLPQGRETLRLPLLDGLRGVAALGVFVFHLPQFFDIRPVLTNAYLLVDLFFLLSGFVLTLAAEPRMAGGLGAIGFMRQRLRRIWPTMALGAAIGAAVFASVTSPSQSAMLLGLALLMIPLTSGHQAVFPLNPPQWSLVWELAGNLLHGALLYRLGERWLLVIAGLGGVVVLASTLYLDSGGAGGVTENWYWAGPRVVWSYVLGVWMARRWTRLRSRALVAWWAALILPLAWLAMLQNMPLPTGWADAFTILVVMPVLFWLAISVVPPRRAVPTLGAMGALSFPLYALHEPILLAVSFQSRSVSACALAIIAAFAASAFVAWIGPRAGKAMFGALGRLRLQPRLAPSA